MSKSNLLKAIKLISELSNRELYLLDEVLQREIVLSEICIEDGDEVRK